MSAKRKKIASNVIERGDERRGTILRFRDGEVEHKAANLQTKRRPRSLRAARNSVATSIHVLVAATARKYIPGMHVQIRIMPRLCILDMTDQYEQAAQNILIRNL